MSWVTDMNEVESWRQDLSSSDVDIRANAAEQLSHAEGAATAAVELVTACGDVEAVQTWAVAALEELGPPPLTALPFLTAAVLSPHALVAYWSATLLGRLGPDGSDSQTSLAHAVLESTEGAVRERAAWALGQVGANSTLALRALHEAAATNSVRLARLAKESLQQIGR